MENAKDAQGQNVEALAAGGSLGGKDGIGVIKKEAGISKSILVAMECHSSLRPHMH